MLNFKPDKLKARLLLMRWAVLGGLALAVGAVAVWGGVRPDNTPANPQNIAGLLNARHSAAEQTKLADQLQAHIDEDTQLVSGLRIQTADIPNNEKYVELPAGSEQSGPLAPNEPVEPDEPSEPNEPVDEVVDQAPEPWVGDELLTVEANLQQMLPPLSGSSGLVRDFGYSYDTAFDDYRFHAGVDLAGSLGAAVLAPLSGTIAAIQEDSFNGSSIVLQHEGKLQTTYYGLTPQPGLQTGQEVIAGEKLGELCATPPFEEGLAPHLHWEIRLDGETLNPLDYL